MNIATEYALLQSISAQVVEAYRDGNLAHAIRCLDRFLKENPGPEQPTIAQAMDRTKARRGVAGIIAQTETPAKYAQLLTQMGALDHVAMAQLAALLCELVFQAKPE